LTHRTTLFGKSSPAKLDIHWIHGVLLLQMYNIDWQMRKETYKSDLWHRWCGNALQHTAIRCTTLQHTATRCNTHIWVEWVVWWLLADEFVHVKETDVYVKRLPYLFMKMYMFDDKRDLYPWYDKCALFWEFKNSPTILREWVGEVGGWGRVPFSRNLMSPTPRRKWYLTTGRRFH